MADFWDKYQEATQATDTLTKLRGLTECITQSEDKSVKRLAAHDLGFALYQGKDGFPQDKEKGKKLMEMSADLGYGPAMNLYGQMLTHEGDLNAIAYFCMALNEGQIPAALNLRDLYDGFSKNGSPELCDIIDSAVGEVVRLLKEDGDLDEDKNGSASLYGLGGKCGVSVADGEAYLQKSVEKGNGIAQTMARNPELKSAATATSFNPYKKKEEASAAPAASVKDTEKDFFDKEPAKETAVAEPEVVDEPVEEAETEPMTKGDWLKFGGIVLGGALFPS